MWYVIAAVALLDAGWSAAIGTTILAGPVVKVVLACGLLFAAGWYFRNRIPQGADAVRLAIVLIAGSNALMVLQNLAATAALPLWDDAFDAWDKALGFDWLAHYHWVKAHPLVDVVLALAYASTAPEMLVAVVVLPLFLNRASPVREFLWAAVISLLVIIPFSALMPAASSFVYYHVGDTQTWGAMFAGLRNGTVRILNEGSGDGIICFPSFHCCLAVLMTWMWRWKKRIMIPMGVVNGLMILSTPSQGSHYLVDSIAGIVVALAAIWIASGCPLPRFAPGELAVEKS